MEHFSHAGQFWLPSTPDRRAPGRLVYDPDALALELHDSLADSPAVRVGRTRTVYPLVHGTLRGRGDVTLIDTAGDPRRGASARVPETWHPNFAVLDALVTQPDFTKVFIRFDALLPWAEAPKATSDEETTFTIRPDSKTVDSATIGDTLITLTVFWEGRFGDE